MSLLLRMQPATDCYAALAGRWGAPNAFLPLQRWNTFDDEQKSEQQRKISSFVSIPTTKERNASLDHSRAERPG